MLAGASPTDAVRYQIVIVFMIAAGAALGTFSVVLLAFRTLLSPEHRLQLEQLQSQR
ncbi:ABC transporter permease [Haemophilus parainfluenzae]|uniref:ABC transporter permease n=1 Tax=Haemophilus parainfluenzae TaxID=729 RepID=UPI001CEDFFD2